MSQATGILMALPRGTTPRWKLHSGKGKGGWRLRNISISISMGSRRTRHGVNAYVLLGCGIKGLVRADACVWGDNEGGVEERCS